LSQISCKNSRNFYKNFFRRVFSFSLPFFFDLVCTRSRQALYLKFTKISIRRMSMSIFFDNVCFWSERRGRALTTSTIMFFLSGPSNAIGGTSSANRTSVRQKRAAGAAIAFFFGVRVLRLRTRRQKKCVFFFLRWRCACPKVFAPHRECKHRDSAKKKPNKMPYPQGPAIKEKKNR
jgi:hypothetical protein